MKVLKIISLLSYCFILLMGMLIPVPFILWLIGSLLIFDNFTDQSLAFLGLTGIVLTIIPWKNGVLKSVVSFIFIILPVINISLRISFEAIDYLGFLMPTSIFIISYLAYLILQIKKLYC
ncbi:hypothetical protein SAMN05443633_107107 [Chryseobacterium arachidis]|uniref:Uncharacterized protein n=1 Tax=Chryseobacterium arachidis TaxID=1416778 RepID=A0A1M5EZ07_9FLAO|nr:hypothetical protein [Chryseobacterium arachidis]SHF84357.1 hypothetical protein SAMN05443633_107107 [Chryseobacterium arachidis]